MFKDNQVCVESGYQETLFLMGFEGGIPCQSIKTKQFNDT